MLKSLSFISLLLAGFLFATEERNYHPFYRIATKKSEILLTSPDLEICSMKTEEVFDYSLAKKEHCILASGNLFKVIQKLRLKDPKRKEFLFIMHQKNGDRVNIKFKTGKKEYSLLAIVYQVKEKGTYVELLDAKSNYYFYSVASKTVRFHILK
jgi:hypothetical protein